MQTNPTAVTLMTSIPLRPPLGEAVGDALALNSTSVEGEDAWSVAINATEATEPSVLFAVHPPAQGGAVGPLPVATSLTASMQTTLGLILAEPSREIPPTPSPEGQGADEEPPSAVADVDTPKNRRAYTDADNDLQPDSTGDTGALQDGDRSVSFATPIAGPVGQTGQQLAPAQVGPSVRVEAPDSARNLVSVLPSTSTIAPASVPAQPVKAVDGGDEGFDQSHDTAPAAAPPAMRRGVGMITDSTENAPLAASNEPEPVVPLDEGASVTKPPSPTAKADMLNGPMGDATGATRAGIGQRPLIPLVDSPQARDNAAIPQALMTKAERTTRIEGSPRGQPEFSSGAVSVTIHHEPKGAAASQRLDAAVPRVEQPAMPREPVDHATASLMRGVGATETRTRPPETLVPDRRYAPAPATATGPQPFTQWQAQPAWNAANRLAESGGGVLPIAGSSRVTVVSGQARDLGAAVQEALIVDAPQPVGSEQALAQGGEALGALSGAERHRAAPAFPLAPPTSAAQAALPVPITVPEDLARQLGVIMTSAPDQPVELVLTPEELGRVRMVLTTQDDGLRLVVQADRPETLDLMRRHADQLTRDFKELGYQNIAFSFDSQSGFQRQFPSGDADRSEDDTPRASDRAETAADRAPVASGYRHRVATVGADGRLDLRL